jgi:hypothetical protein
MGRELRRVPMTFDWPLNKVWKGYLNPHYRECPKAATNECHAGSTNAGKWMDAICRFLALIGEQAVEEPYADKLRARGQIFPHPYLRDFPQAPRTQIPHEIVARLRELEQREAMAEHLRYLQQHPPQLLPFTEELVQFVTGLAGRKPDPPFGGNLEWDLQKALLKAAGIDPESKWGICKVCDGHGIDPAVRETYESWQPEPPPEGPGYQLWSTTSEGAPISPVLGTLDALCAWAETNATTFAHFKTTAAKWKEMLTKGFVFHKEGNDLFL